MLCVVGQVACVHRGVALSWCVDEATFLRVSGLSHGCPCPGLSATGKMRGGEDMPLLSLATHSLGLHSRGQYVWGKPGPFGWGKCFLPV